jgi:hypothetical protein
MNRTSASGEARLIARGTARTYSGVALWLLGLLLACFAAAVPAQAQLPAQDDLSGHLVSGSASGVAPDPAKLPVYQPGWNLVSGPGGSHVAGATGSLYTLPNGSTSYTVVPVANALQACRAYWAYFPGPGPGHLDTTGSTPQSSCSVPSTPGQWFMAGNPALTAASIAGASQALAYTGSYNNVSVLPVGYGVLAMASSGVTITAMGGSGQSGPPALPPSSGNAPQSSNPMGSCVSIVLGTGPICPLGVTGKLSDGWQLTVNSVQSNATGAVLAENSLNSAPPAGQQYLLVNVTVTWTGAGSDNFDDTARLRLLTPSGTSYNSTCPSFPKEVPGTNVPSGTTETGNTCFTIATSDVNSKLEMVDTASSDPSTWTYFYLFPP